MNGGTDSPRLYEEDLHMYMILSIKRECRLKRKYFFNKEVSDFLVSVRKSNKYKTLPKVIIKPIKIQPVFIKM